MSNNTGTQPNEQINPLFVDHCSHLQFLDANLDSQSEYEFADLRNSRFVDECGNYVIGGPGNCHRSNQTI